jgi:glucose 1-dehydrogenase/3-oxoacyl-[acyl-carrier protein] reductase
VLASDVSLEAAQETAALIEEAGGTALAARVDVRVRDDIAQAAQQAVTNWGGLHLLVNNAGLITKHSFKDLTEEAWDLVLDVNLKGQYLVAQEIAPLIAAAGGGAIVNLSSVEGVVVVTSGASAQPHYNASKGGVPMLTKALAIELAPHGIRVNCVAPGPIATNFFDLAAVTSDAGLQFLKQRLLIPRVGLPADVASAVSWLLSDEASWIDGVQLPVDGGWLTR